MNSFSCDKGTIYRQLFSIETGVFAFVTLLLAEYLQELCSSFKVRPISFSSTVMVCINYRRFHLKRVQTSTAKRSFALYDPSMSWQWGNRSWVMGQRGRRKLMDHISQKVLTHDPSVFKGQWWILSLLEKLLYIASAQKPSIGMKRKDREWRYATVVNEGFLCACNEGENVVSRDPWALGHMGHMPIIPWVIRVMGQYEWPISSGSHWVERSAMCSEWKQPITDYAQAKDNKYIVGCEPQLAWRRLFTPTFCRRAILTRKDSLACNEGLLVVSCMQDYKSLCAAVTIGATAIEPTFDFFAFWPLWPWKVGHTRGKS